MNRAEELRSLLATPDDSWTWMDAVLVAAESVLADLDHVREAARSLDAVLNDDDAGNDDVRSFAVDVVYAAGVRDKPAEPAAPAPSPDAHLGAGPRGEG